MDSQDIFRKLSRGAKFKERVAVVPPFSVNGKFTDGSQNQGIGSGCKRKPQLSKVPSESSSEKVRLIEFYSNPLAKTERKTQVSEVPSKSSSKNVRVIEFYSNPPTKTELSEVSNESSSKNVGLIEIYSNSSKQLVKEESDSEISDDQPVGMLEEHQRMIKARIAQFRKDHKIHVKGSDVPDPIESFEQFYERFDSQEEVLRNLYKMGYRDPTPIQMQAMPIIAMDRQILACAPTGSGKTAAFIVPILYKLGKPSRNGFRALVLCPTRELAQQTFRECIKLTENTGIKAHIVSKVSKDSNKFGSKFSTKFDILISTPNRLIFLLRKGENILDFRSLEWLVVDECDKLFEEGAHGFRDQLSEIYEACNKSTLKRLMFSATHMAHLAKWCKENLKGLISVTVGQRNTTADIIEQELLYVGNERGKLLALRELINKGLAPPVLIFVQSKDRAKELFRELIYDEVRADVIHAERTQLERDNVVKAFREGKIWMLICTELMGRGIDFKGVKLVINYDFPPSAVSYIHRIGRTGRAGRPGKAVTFFTEDDKPVLRSIALVMRESGCPVPEFMLQMKKTDRRKRKYLENHPPERENISTEVTLSTKKNVKPVGKLLTDTNKVKGKQNTSPIKGHQKKKLVQSTAKNNDSVTHEDKQGEPQSLTPSEQIKKKKKKKVHFTNGSSIRKEKCSSTRKLSASPQKQ